LNRPYFCNIFFFIVLLASVVSAQDFFLEDDLDTIPILPDTQKTSFQVATELYNMERYWDALNIFKEINEIPRRSNRYYTASTLMLIKTYLRLGDIENCMVFGKRFENYYANSEYYDDVLYTLGEAYFRNGEYENALQYYLKVMQNTRDGRLLRKSRQTVEVITDVFMSLEQIQNLRGSLGEYFGRTYIGLKLVEKYHSQGDLRSAIREMRQIRPTILGSFLNNEFERTRDILASSPDSKVYIGVVLPLTGPDASIGTRILNGLRFALQRYKEESGSLISAIVIDNHGEVVKSIKQMEYLARNPRVVAILGPVSSENAVPMAVLANREKIPMITPTATYSGLSDLGPYVFQANVDYTNLGRYLGEYARTALNIKTVASLSPADSYGKEMTDAFCSEIDELGGRVISQQWYTDAPQELKYQFSNIRQLGLDLMRDRLEERKTRMIEKLRKMALNDSTWRSDSLYLLTRDKDCRLFRNGITSNISYRRALICTGLMDSTEFIMPKKDSVEFRINSIDGLLLPSRASDVELIAPQIAYYNLNTVILGNANWKDLSILRKQRGYLNRLTFVSDYYIDEKSEIYTRFEKEYSAKVGYPPDRLDLYGYDTMYALLSVFKPGEISREQIRKNLSSMEVYNGICRNISFVGNRPRVNSCAYILSFENNEIRCVARIENGNLIILAGNSG